MAICEFSGESCNSTIQVEIAGAIMNVAPKYSHLGKIIEKKKEYTPSKSTTIYKKSRIELRVVNNAAQKIQQYMSKNNITLKQVAFNSNVKEGSLQKMLLGKVQFDLKIAQAIEKAFNLELTQEENINEVSNQEYILEDDEVSNTSQMEELMKGVLDQIDQIKK